jgi:hypothetical protein
MPDYRFVTLVQMPNPIYLLIGSVSSANKYEKVTLVEMGPSIQFFKGNPNLQSELL